jgi:hypothetical protein
MWAQMKYIERTMSKSSIALRIAFRSERVTALGAAVVKQK